MASTTDSMSSEGRPQAQGLREVAARVVGEGIEIGVLALVFLAPWAFGSTPPHYRLILDLGVAALTALWGARMVLAGRLIWRKCPVVWCLAAFILVGACQLVPLPEAVLRRISPATARLYDRLLPARQEVPPAGDSVDTPRLTAGSTISLYPGATRRELGRYLAVLLLFVIVRSNVSPSSGLKRLAIGATVNGFLLAFFGLVQAFSADPHTLYWTYPTNGQPFGPFINKNHFAFYVNVCAALGCGLLLSRIAVRGRPSVRQTPRRAIGAGSHARHDRGGGSIPSRGALGPVLDPTVLGIIFALGLMISSVLLSLSRGGFMALLGGLVIGVMLRLRQHSGLQQARGVLLARMAAVTMVCWPLALICWLGYDQVLGRIATLQGVEALQESRLSMWSRAFPLVRDFPLWGTGDGTYEFVESLHRVTDTLDADMIIDHAHNDYLEILVEGGLAQLVPAVLAIVLVWRFGLHAARRSAGLPTGGLAIGALMGLATVSIHSFSDFGMHIPACAALVTVLCAYICGEGEAGAGGAAVRMPGERNRALRRLGRLAPALGAGSTLAVGLLLAHEGSRVYRAQRLAVAASEQDLSHDPARLERKVAYLEEATRLVPEDVRLQVDVATAHFVTFGQRMYELAKAAGGDSQASPGSAVPSTGTDDSEAGRLRREHLAPALLHLTRARDLCPLWAEIHMELAHYTADFAAAEARGAYLARAKLLSPAKADIWYRCGLYELEDKQPDRAWESWRRSLELSDLCLRQILDRSRSALGPSGILERVLPDRPDLLAAAAAHLCPTPGEGRRPFLERALAVLAARPGPPSAQDLHLRATIERDLGRSAEALATYREALIRDPQRLEWRGELAELANEQGKYEDSRQELLTILSVRPDDAHFRALLDEVTRKIAAGL
jgi:O-antigen ligase/tetratricopeptide (TPR) repeat protein